MIFNHQIRTTEFDLVLRSQFHKSFSDLVVLHKQTTLSQTSYGRTVAGKTSPQTYQELPPLLKLPTKLPRSAIESPDRLALT